MQDRVYIANPTGSGPTYTVDLYFTGNPANARTGDQVVDSLGHLYTLTGLDNISGLEYAGTAICCYCLDNTLYFNDLSLSCHDTFL